jgi:hypothetical protein
MINEIIKLSLKCKKLKYLSTTPVEINFLMKPGENYIMEMVARTKFKKYQPVFVHQNVVDQGILCNELAMKIAAFWDVTPCDMLEI